VEPTAAAKLLDFVRPLAVVDEMRVRLLGRMAASSPG
jgi:hypothetical protein